MKEKEIICPYCGKRFRAMFPLCPHGCHFNMPKLESKPIEIKKSGFIDSLRERF